MDISSNKSIMQKLNLKKERDDFTYWEFLKWKKDRIIYELRFRNQMDYAFDRIVGYKKRRNNWNIFDDQ